MRPEDRVIYSGNIPNRGRDSNLSHHEPVAMVNGIFLVLSP